MIVKVIIFIGVKSGGILKKPVLELFLMPIKDR
jgi:hypothetical protein